MLLELLELFIFIMLAIKQNTCFRGALVAYESIAWIPRSAESVPQDGEAGVLHH